MKKNPPLHPGLTAINTGVKPLQERQPYKHLQEYELKSQIGITAYQNIHLH